MNWKTLFINLEVFFRLGCGCLPSLNRSNDVYEDSEQCSQHGHWRWHSTSGLVNKCNCDAWNWWRGFRQSVMWARSFFIYHFTSGHNLAKIPFKTSEAEATQGHCSFSIHSPAKLHWLHPSRRRAFPKPTLNQIHHLCAELVCDTWRRFRRWWRFHGWGNDIGHGIHDLGWLPASCAVGWRSC